MRRALMMSMALAGGCVLGRGDCVDETGYLNCDLNVDGVEDDPGRGGLTDSPSSDEDHGASAVPEGLYFTAPDPLGPIDRPVTIVAVRGTFEGQTSLSLRVLGRPGEVDVLVVGGAFVGRIQAALDDVVIVRDVDGQTVGELTLAQDVAAEDADTAGMPPASPGAALPEAWNTFADDTSGRLPVGDGTLGIQAPYLVFNTTGGDAVAVEEGDTDVTLAATPGDEVCLVLLDLAGRAGLESCWTL